MHDMEKAVARIQQTVEAGEQILVYGDYDADGITSTTVMKEAIRISRWHGSVLSTESFCSWIWA